MKFSSIIHELTIWEKPDYEKDRKLSDEILLLDDWEIEEDGAYLGEDSWSKNDIIISATDRPHPINDLNVAFELIPKEASLELRGDAKYFTCTLFVDTMNNRLTRYVGHSIKPSIALIIAVLRSKEKKQHG